MAASAAALQLNGNFHLATHATSKSASKKSRKSKSAGESKTLIEDHYQQAAATIQALIPQMAENDLGLSDLEESSPIKIEPDLDPSDPLNTVGLSQVQFGLSQIQIPKSLVVGATDELDINFVQGPLRDSDITIRFDEDEPRK